MDDLIPIGFPEESVSIGNAGCLICDPRYGIRDGTIGFPLIKGGLRGLLFYIMC